MAATRAATVAGMSGVAVGTGVTVGTGVGGGAAQAINTAANKGSARKRTFITNSPKQNGSGGRWIGKFAGYSSSGRTPVSNAGGSSPVGPGGTW